VTLQPGYGYIFFAMYGPEDAGALPNRVPNEGGLAESLIYFSAVDDTPPFQFHQAFPFWVGDEQINQVATSRLIPVVPEPSAGLLLVLGFVGLRRKRAARA
jgi:hypothetical protein